MLVNIPSARNESGDVGGGRHVARGDGEGAGVLSRGLGPPHSAPHSYEALRGLRDSGPAQHQAPRGHLAGFQHHVPIVHIWNKGMEQQQLSVTTLKTINYLINSSYLLEFYYTMFVPNNYRQSPRSAMYSTWQNGRVGPAKHVSV